MGVLFNRIALAFIFSLGLNAFAETKISQKRAEIDSQKIIEVRYSNPAWNKNPSAIDTGVIILRDSNSKKTLQIMLEETAPDSSIFSGIYSINWGAEGIKPEVYVLGGSHLMGEKELAVVLKKIDDGQIKRRPLFYRKSDHGKQTLQVFDDKSQLEQALQLIRVQNSQGLATDTTSVTNNATANAIMTSQEIAQFARDNDKRRKMSQQHLIDRFREQQTEKNRIESMQRAQTTLSAVEKQKREKQADDFADAALDYYRSGQYAQAEEYFHKSFDLNPTDTKHYFQYGLSLFKNNKFNEAIVAFNMSKDDKEFELESIYYSGLSEYNLKEYEQALTHFNQLEQKKNKEMSPLASFYAGIVMMEQKDYDHAKDKFQMVLDTSNDTKLDEKAEKYIEDINQAIQYAKNKQKKIFLSGTLGTMYDSNVLQQSDSSSDQGTASSKGSLRYLLGVGGYYRAIDNEKYEFGPKLRSDYIYTQTSTLTDYDPWSIQLTAPFAYKSTFKGKPMKLSVTPGFESLYLGQEQSSGKPQKSLEGYYVELAPTFLMNENWISTYSLTYRKDVFFQSSDQLKNANKITFNFSNVLFVNQPKTKSVLINAGFTSNISKGSDTSYIRYDLNALYICPVFRPDLILASGLGLYTLNYDQRSTTESDFNKTLNATLSKQLSDIFSASALASYVLNGSDQSSAQYNKWTLGIVFNAEYGL